MIVSLRIVGLGLLLGLLLAAGCSSENGVEKGPFSASRKGGYLRLINLAEGPATLNFGDRQFFAAPPETATSFALYRPGTHAADVTVGGKGHRVTLKVEPEKTLTVYVLADSKDPVRIVEGDPRSGAGNQSLVRLTNLTQTPISVAEGKVELEADAGSSDEPAPLAPGAKSFRLEPSGDSIGFEAAAGRAYLIVAYRVGGKVRTLVAESGAPMQTAEGGASASG